MPKAPDFPSVDAEETVWLGWNFSPLLAVGETIESVDTTVCEIFTGVDASASSRLTGDAEIDAAPSGRVSAMIRRMFTGGVGGVVYNVLATANTSTGEKLCVWAHLPVVTPR